MEIRKADPSDYDKMLAMGQHFIEQTPYRDSLPNDPALWRETIIKGVLAHETKVALVAEEDGQLYGMLVGLVGPHLLIGEITGQELFWWAEPAKRTVGLRLLKAFVEACRSRGATRIHMVAPTERVAQLYQKLGYVHYESTYELRLNGGS